MYHIQEILPQIYWVGGSDWKLERFENMLPLPYGISYNSFLILDEKTALFDTVESAISDLFLNNVINALGDRTLDYLIVNHMEPDHSADIEEIVRLYPKVKVVGNQRTFQYYEQFYSLNISSNYLEVKECSELSLGKYQLRFLMAPMLHWPEVMFAYEITTGILFSADAFGSFGAITGNLFYDELEYSPEETRRYYANILGRFGMPVQSALKKLSGLQINMICTLHGPLWRNEDVSYILGKYDQWSRYEAEETGVIIVFASMYGNTQNAAELLAGKLSTRGIRNILMYDVSKTHSSFIIGELWRYSHVVFASPTYNMHLYPPMEYLLRELNLLGYTNRKVSFIGNHTWLDASLEGMSSLINSKSMTVIGQPISILSSLKPAQDPEVEALADAIFQSMDSEISPTSV